VIGRATDSRMQRSLIGRTKVGARKDRVTTIVAMPIDRRGKWAENDSPEPEPSVSGDEVFLQCILRQQP
jgi:hypothetical protein